MLLIVCIAALAGLLVGDLNRLDALSLGAAAGASALGCALIRFRSGWRLVALVACAAALGALRAELHRPADPDPLAQFANLTLRLRGRVDSSPQTTERSVRFRLLVEQVGTPEVNPAPSAVGATAGHGTAAPRTTATATTDGMTAPGATTTPHGTAVTADTNSNGTQVTARITVIADPSDAVSEALALGDLVEVSGRLGAPDPTTSRGSAVERTLVYPRLMRLEEAGNDPRALAARLRTSAIREIQEHLPEPQASLAAGVLLGGSGRLSPEFKQQLERSGLAHIVAIDGYKQVMVTAALAAVAVRTIGRPWAALPILVGVLGYTMLTGARPSAVRAGIMVSLATLANVVGHMPDSLTSLLFAATLMAAADPDVLLDVGFQLSVSATLGLILLWPRMRRALRGVPSLIAEPAGVTFAVTLATLPVMVSVFHSVSLISPIAHVVGMPLLPAVLLGAALLPLAAPLPPLQETIATLTNLPTTLLVETVRGFGNLPTAALSTGRLPPGAAAALCGLLVLWGAWNLPDVVYLRRTLIDRPPWEVPWQRPALVALGCALGLGGFVVVRPDGKVHVAVLSVAPGQAVLIRGPTGRAALVGRGRLDGRALVSQVAERLAVWEHGLDTAIALDQPAAERMEMTLERYPARRQLGSEALGSAVLPPASLASTSVASTPLASAPLAASTPLASASVASAPVGFEPSGFALEDDRVDLGGGAVLDVYARAPSEPAVALSFGHTWVRVFGHPPPPRAAPDGEAPTLMSADADLALDSNPG